MNKNGMDKNEFYNYKGQVYIASDSSIINVTQNDTPEYYSDDEPINLYRDCIVKISVNNGGAEGTGFFIAPRIILTCTHVVVYNYEKFSYDEVINKVKEADILITIVKIKLSLTTVCDEIIFPKYSYPQKSMYYNKKGIIFVIIMIKKLRISFIIRNFCLKFKQIDEWR
jgi:galactitol-specific phosphotransferase system IIB component